MKKEECVKILRLFNELKPAVSNVPTCGRMVNKAGSLRAQRQQRRAQCSWQGQRAATLSPHSARTDAPCTQKQTPPTSVRARIAPVVASFIRRSRHINERSELHILIIHEQSE
ncbi:MAG TPA: hypothetical protein VJ871_01615 [Bacteroidales bacterium]|nr:hypothetical protein [Bacteroidales bacterium]